MKKMRILALAMATMLTFGMVSCGDPDEELPYEGIELANGEFIEIESFGNDASAAYKLHFKVYLSDSKLVVEGLESKSEFSMIPATTVLNTAVKIADFGKVGGLTKIDEIPADADFADSQVATEKHGYVVSAVGAANLDSYGNPDIHDPKMQYMRIWLEEATDKGYKLRYDFPFVPAE